MAIVQRPSDLFTIGRDCPLQSVVLHQYTSGIEMLDQEMDRCLRPRPLTSPGCHTSFHFGICGNCHLHQYVDIDNTAWGFFDTPESCPAPLCPPTPCASCTGLTNDQYNPDMDGNPPFVVPIVPGADGTANCAVLHVAVCNIFPNTLGGACCDPNPDAYECLVNSLCEIFRAADLVPTQASLLVHCGELICLDIDQLVTDVIACMIVPPPVSIPCNCTPTTAQFCASLATVPEGDPAVPGATMILGDDCEFHLLPAIPAADVTIVGLDTATVDITVVEAPVNTFTISATVTDVPPAVFCAELAALLAGDPGVAGVDSYVGADCETHLLPIADVTLVALDTATVNMVIVEAPANTFTVSANVVTDDLLALIETCDGPYVDQTVVTSEAWAASIPSATPARIWTSPSEADCPTILSGVAYDELLLTPVDVVLGVDPADDTTVTWGRLINPALVIDTFTDINTALIQDADVHVYIGVPGHNVDLDPPTTSRNNIWVKNRSANTLTITPTSGTIDGVAAITLQGTIPTGYPFGNDGGESAHLFWDGTNWLVL